jgi:hypothetical protein
MAQPSAHWDSVYDRRPVTEVSWFQASPTVSLELIGAAKIAEDVPVIDIGGGASTLVDRLLDAGYLEVSVLDIAAPALLAAQTRLGPWALQVHWYSTDVLGWEPPRTYGLWHDRAVFHFLTDPADRDRYRRVLRRALIPGGYVVIGTFAADGPTHCSGLPTSRYAPDQLAAEFADFRVVRELREEHHTPAGHIQPFTWLLLSS